MVEKIPPYAGAPAAPRLTLVLGSGGVRSAAAIGVARVLAREGLAPALIVGCSSGALFGACLALGWSPDEALARTQALWSRELTEQRRWRAYAQLLAPRWAGFGPDFALRDSRLIAERLARAFGAARIEQCATPLRIVAADAATGARQVLAAGPLAQAVRASMAVPLVFPPVAVGTQSLVDGVMADPLPVGVAAPGDVVVALGFRGALPRRVDRIGRLVGRVSTIVLNNLLDARLEAARAAGQRIVAVQPAIDPRLALWDTRALARMAERGAEAAEAALPAIHAAWQDARAAPPCLDGARPALAPPGQLSVAGAAMGLCDR